MSELENHPNILAAKAKGTFGFVDVGCSAPWPDEAIIAATGGCYPAPVQLADGRWVGARFDHDEGRRELVVQDGEQRRTMAIPNGWETSSRVVISPSGERVLLRVRVSGRGQVVERPLDGSGDWSVVASAVVPGRASHLYLNREDLWAADYAGDDDTLVLAVAAGKDRQLLLMRRTANGWREIDNCKHKGIEAVGIGRLIVSRHDKGIDTFGIVGEGLDAQLVKSGALEKMLVFVHPADTRAQLWGHQGGGDQGRVLVGVEEALAGKKAKRRKQGIVLAPRYAPGTEPVAASYEQMIEHFGADHASKHIRAATRSRGGRIIADAPGRSLIVSDGEIIEVEGTIRFPHPRAERALVSTDGGAISVVDLLTGKRSKPLAKGVWQAFYLVADDRTLLAIERKGEQLTIHDDPGEPGRAKLGPALASVDLDGASFHPGPDGHAVRVAPGKKAGTWSLALWRVGADGSLSHAHELVLPGSRYAKSQCYVRVVGEVHMLSTLETDPELFELPHG